MATIEIHRTTLSNGLRVVVCPDHASPNVTVDVMYHVGSFDERPDRTGLAHLFEHLMFDNTTTGVLKQYDTLCTKAGGSNNAYTTYDYTNYYINLPAHQAELGFWLEAERMKAFMITDHALETQRSVVIEEINQNVIVVGDYKAFNKDHPEQLVEVDVRVRHAEGFIDHAPLGLLQSSQPVPHA